MEPRGSDPRVCVRSDGLAQIRGVTCYHAPPGGVSSAVGGRRDSSDPFCHGAVRGIRSDHAPRFE